ncbi:hypothetical protein NP233_g10638 [Leucocoprinus birnbaumii]|uniref:Ubiquitin thioesterase OTU n=1 Tax=Leucocoprinus birnbaumii TaxID=56174 RepID=A0AAD5VKC6_9AGAR|nr:hypothetical protein NP233_g10638 [Leucocoprinus birnbaumii]
MAPVRLRHPKGVSTLQLPLDDDTFTVRDFQQQIYSTSDIPPSRQAVKTGYPPRSLTLIPELPFSSLGIVPGDQIIVSEIPGSVSAVSAPPPDSRQAPLPTSNFADGLQPTTNASSPNSSSGHDFVDTGDGSVLVHRVVPDDNSCLFSSTALIFEQNMANAQTMRKIVAEGIRADPETYNEAILGMPPAQYINAILKPTTWGGAIELGILAKHYNVEIASIDVETGRIDYFSPPESASTGMRCVLIYSGIHYDAASLAPIAGAPAEWHQTLFHIVGARIQGSENACPKNFQGPDQDADSTIVALKKLAGILRMKKAFTNTSTFDLRCEQCGKGLKGEREARAHAEETGHSAMSAPRPQLTKLQRAIVVLKNYGYRSPNDFIIDFYTSRNHSSQSLRYQDGMAYAPAKLLEIWLRNVPSGRSFEELNSAIVYRPRPSGYGDRFEPQSDYLFLFEGAGSNPAGVDCFWTVALS